MLDKRLVVVTGKGGVGRSALAAALALNGARTGRKVLLAGMTDGIGVAGHLTVKDLDYRPREVRPGLHALAVDPAVALDEYLRLQLKLPRFGPASRAFAVLADTVPGVRDTVVIGKVLYEAVRGDWDLVVADGPPIGQITSYLRAPAVIKGLVPSGRVERQAAWMADTLEDPDQTAIVLATLAEELPVLETLEALEDLDAEGYAPSTSLVINRVLPDDVDEDDLDELEPGPARDAGTLHRGLVAAQREWLGRLPDAPRLPFLFGVHTPGEVAVRLADLWEMG